MGLEAKVVPTRFLSSIAHFIVVVLVFSTKADNLNSGLAVDRTQSVYDTASSELTAALWLSVVCFIIEFFGLLGGYSLFKTAHNTFYIACHCAGAVLVSLFVLDEWNYKSFWYLWGFFSLPPALIEMVSIIRMYVCVAANY
eukprot:46339_1